MRRGDDYAIRLLPDDPSVDACRDRQSVWSSCLGLNRDGVHTVLAVGDVALDRISTALRLSLGLNLNLGVLVCKPVADAVLTGDGKRGFLFCDKVRVFYVIHRECIGLGICRHLSDHVHLPDPLLEVFVDGKTDHVIVVWLKGMIRVIAAEGMKPIFYLRLKEEELNW